MSKPPERTLNLLEQRLKDHVKKKWAGKVKSLSVRVRGVFVYIDAEITKPKRSFAFAGQDDEGEQPLCRLRYLGCEDEWEFAFFSWSRGARGGYEPSYLNNGQPVGPPEECFDCAAFSWQ